MVGKVLFHDGVMLCIAQRSSVLGRDGWHAGVAVPRLVDGPECRRVAESNVCLPGLFSVSGRCAREADGPEVGDFHPLRRREWN